MPTPKQLAFQNFLQSINSGYDQGFDSQEKLKQLLFGSQLKRQEAQAGEDLKNQGASGRLDKLAEFLKANPQFEGGTLGADSASIRKKDPGLAQDRLDVSKQRLESTIIPKVTGDFDKVSVDSKSRLQALQAVQEALSKGDIASLGQLKANMVMLENQKSKPTDSERKIIIPDTAKGWVIDKLNKLGIANDLPLSDSQKKAFSDFVLRKQGEEQSNIDRARKEVLTRWGSSLGKLDPQTAEGLANSLGMSGADLIQHLASKNAKLPGSPAAVKPAQGAPKMIRVKDIKSGQTGQLPESEFDSNLYQRL